MSQPPYPENALPEADAPTIWAAIDRIVDGNDDVERLRSHRLHLLAARRWRARGRQVPAAVLAAERRSALTSMLVPEVLTRVRRAVDGPIIVHKGPEVAKRYPDPIARPYVDLDLLVSDADSAQRALQQAGFYAVGDPAAYVGSPHRQPLEFPELPLVVEVHESPNWPRWLGRVPTADLLAGAVDSNLAVDGVLTLAPAHHALAVAAHAWAHGPLARIGDLLDVSVMSAELDPQELRTLAASWGLARLWQTTTETADAVLRTGGRTWALATWARNLGGVRERTVFEYHLGRWAAPFSAVPFRAAVRVMGQEIGKDLRPRPGEEWGPKLGRTGQALRRAGVRKSEHDEALNGRGEE